MPVKKKRKQCGFKAGSLGAALIAQRDAIISENLAKAKKVKLPSFVQVDLFRGKDGRPDIKCGVPYLAKVNGRYHAGTFIEYKWFDTGHHVMRFVIPGETGDGMWEGLWEIVE